MGVLFDSVEAEFGGHHYAVRTTMAAFGFGVRCTLYVDGRQTDVQTAMVLGREISLLGAASGELVTLTVKQGLTSTRYRLFVGEVEVPLHVEPGQSAVSVDIRPPVLAWARLAELPEGEVADARVPQRLR